MAVRIITKTERISCSTTGQSPTIFHFLWFHVKCISRYNSGGVLQTNAQQTGFRFSSFLECFSLVLTTRLSFVTWIHPYCSRSCTDLDMLLHLFLLFFHIAAFNTRDWICCSICALTFLNIGFLHRKHYSCYLLPLRGCVSLWPLKSIYILLMCSHYARVYWVSCFGDRINTICGKITSLVLLVVRSFLCST